MNFKVYKNANVFEQKAEPILLEKEDVFSLFLGVLQGIKAGKYEHPFMGTIEEEGKVLALFQWTPPYPINLFFADETRLDELMDLFVNKVVELEIDFQSIVSLKPWAYEVASKWEVKTGRTHSLIMNQGLYRLDKVNETLEGSCNC